MSEAVSKSIGWLMLAMTPFAISFLMISIGVIFSFCERSRTVMISGSSIGGGGAAGRDGAGAAAGAPGR
jgi:hypothetical protein